MALLRSHYINVVLRIWSRACLLLSGHKHGLAYDQRPMRIAISETVGAYHRQKAERCGCPCAKSTRYC
jgi:hypothetical protein